MKGSSIKKEEIEEEGQIFRLTPTTQKKRGMHRFVLYAFATVHHPTLYFFNQKIIDFLNIKTWFEVKNKGRKADLLDSQILKDYNSQHYQSMKTAMIPPVDRDAPLQEN